LEKYFGRPGLSKETFLALRHTCLAVADCASSAWVLTHANGILPTKVSLRKGSKLVWRYVHFFQIQYHRVTDRQTAMVYRVVHTGDEKPDGKRPRGPTDFSPEIGPSFFSFHFLILNWNHSPTLQIHNNLHCLPFWLCQLTNCEDVAWGEPEDQVD